MHAALNGTFYAFIESWEDISGESVLTQIALVA